MNKEGLMSKILSSGKKGLNYVMMPLLLGAPATLNPAQIDAAAQMADSSAEVTSYIVSPSSVSPSTVSFQGNAYRRIHGTNLTTDEQTLQFYLKDSIAPTSVSKTDCIEFQGVQSGSNIYDTSLAYVDCPRE